MAQVSPDRVPGQSDLAAMHRLALDTREGNSMDHRPAHPRALQHN